MGAPAKYLAFLIFVLFSAAVHAQVRPAEPVRIGVIYSETGTMMTSEQPLIAATRVAVEDINRTGGIMGRRLELSLRDGASSPEVAARVARSLIRDDGVTAIFGCWTSACRKAVMAVVEEEGSALFYPVQYEGRGVGALPIDPSPSVFYAGAAPNQQIVPVIDWILSQTPSPRIMLIGSDYVYPRSANAFIKRLLEGTGAVIVDEQYFPLGGADFSSLGARLRAARPDVILNTVNGLDNIALFNVIARYDPDGRLARTISFSIDENQLREIGEANFVGRYAVWNYFHDSANPFVARFLNRYRYFGGSDDWSTSDPVEAAYVLVHLFADAARRSGALDINSLRRGSRNLVLEGFSGPLFVDQMTQHLWKPAQISRYGSTRSFEPVWDSQLLIQPVPILENMPGQFAQVLRYPVSSREVAQQMLRGKNPIDRLRGLRWLIGNRAQVRTSELPDPAATSFTLAEIAAIVELIAMKGDEAFLSDFSWLLGRLDGNAQKTAIAVAQMRLAALGDADPAAVSEKLFAVLESEADPMWQRILLVSLARLDRPDTQWFGRAMTRLGAADPSVLIPALDAARQHLLADPTFYAALGALPARRDFATAPGLADAYCATLDQQLTLAMARGADVPDGLASVIETSVADIEQRCPQVLISYQRISRSAFAALLESARPQTPADWAFFITIAAAVPILLYLALLAVALWLAPARAIRRFRPFAHRRESYPMVIQKALDVVPSIGLRTRAIDLWIDANRQAFAPQGSDQDFYQDLVVEVRSPGGRGISIADSGFIKRTICEGDADRPVRVAILGEGGVGKSTLSQAILRTLASDASCPRIGLFIEAERVADIQNIDDIREAVCHEFARLLRAARGQGTTDKTEADSGILVNRLLETGRLLVVFDDLSRALDGQWTLAASPSFDRCLRAVVYTGRFPVAGFDLEIFPQPLDRPRLIAFVESHVARSGRELSVAQRQILEDSLDQIFAARDHVPALFAVLIGRHFVAERDGSDPPQAITIPALVMSYVESLFGRISGNELLGLEPSNFWRVAGALSWACLSQGLRVSHIGIPTAEEAVAKYVRAGDTRPIIDLLCDETPLVHRVRGNRVVIASEALAEYLAGCWLFASSADGRWERHHAEIDAQINAARTEGKPPDYMRTFLLALRDVADSADVSPGGQAASRIISSRSAIRRLDGWLALWRNEHNTIRVGILHSLTGVMAISERPLVEAAKLAIDRINRRGGIAGRMLEPVVKDGASDEGTFASRAREFADEGIVFIFGCWTSASRIEVLRVLDSTGGLLFYPVQYEGYEANENALYFGAAPNQQIIPAVEWCLAGPLRARRFLSIGSDYIFPRVANEVIAETIAEHGDKGAELVCDPLYVPLSGYSLDLAVAEIEERRPDVILNLLNGSANLDFFWRLYEISRGDYQPKVMSFSIGDHEVQRIGAEVMEGHYACWTYFCSLDNMENAAFLRSMRTTAGVFFPSDPAEAAYSQMLAFARAAEGVLAQQGDLSVKAVRKSMIGMEFRSPAGDCQICENGHVAKKPRIGRLGAGSQFEQIWEAGERQVPEPFPYQSIAARIRTLRRNLHKI